MDHGPVGGIEPLVQYLLGLFLGGRIKYGGRHSLFGKVELQIEGVGVGGPDLPVLYLVPALVVRGSKGDDMPWFQPFHIPPVSLDGVSHIVNVNETVASHFQRELLGKMAQCAGHGTAQLVHFPVVHYEPALLFAYRALLAPEISMLFAFSYHPYSPNRYCRGITQPKYLNFWTDSGKKLVPDF